jgi:hypothetical protein
VTRDFGQGTRYHPSVIALRVPLCLSLGIATAATAGLALARPTPPGPSAPDLPGHTPPEPLEMRWQSDSASCDPDAITAVVIRGQFTASVPQSFAISFGGASGHYTAITDDRGYFEVRIPREDFDGDVCRLPLRSKDFSDDQMTLQYRIDVEH